MWNSHHHKSILFMSENLIKPFACKLYACLHGNHMSHSLETQLRHQPNLTKHLCNNYQKCVTKCSQSHCLSTNAEPKQTIDSVLSEDNFERVRKQISKVKTVRSAEALRIKQKPSEAAVLIPLCYVEGEPSILFTVRSTSLRKHSGEVSFPGGLVDSTDRNIVHSALREMEEEIGIPMETVTVLGSMPPLPSRLNLFVTPVLGFCGEIDKSKLNLNSDEVEVVFHRSIESLCDLSNFRTTQFRTRNGYTLPVFLGGSHRIWGFTAVALHQTLTLLTPSLYKAKIRHRPKYM